MRISRPFSWLFVLTQAIVAGQASRIDFTSWPALSHVADILYVVLLIRLTRREGIRLRDLVGRGRNMALDLL
jgi:hypothetical protein